MAGLTPKERLQPSLLDRLIDDEPRVSKESRNKRVLSLQQLRQLVKRDLAWLLNTGHLETLEDLDAYPEVKTSVVNYGIDDLSGRAVAGVQASDLERIVRNAIINFEPRILKNSIQVTASVSTEHMNRNAITFTIEGQLWAQPVPIQLFLKTEVDLDNGNVQVTDGRGD